VYLVDLRLVKEVRPGKTSPDFEKWSEEARRHDTSICFVLFYGREFRLKTLSLAGRKCWCNAAFTLAATVFAKIFAENLCWMSMAFVQSFVYFLLFFDCEQLF